MKLIRDKKKAEPISSVSQTETSTVGELVDCKIDFSTVVMLSDSWKILIVDDEPEVHVVTKLSASDLLFDGKKIEFLSALSAQQARFILAEHRDIAIALVDVVMETEDAGLRLVEYIRQELGNRQIRLIIRTGQPGTAPERYVIEHYDIDDYKDKTELTAQRLYTTLRTALKIYRDFILINHNREGLEKILAAAPDLYQVRPMKQFLEGILAQVMSLCAAIGANNLMIAYIRDDKTPTTIQVGTGRFANINEELSNEPVLQLCQAVIFGEKNQDILPSQVILLPLRWRERKLGFIYLENVSKEILYEDNNHLLQVMATQCAAALYNLELYADLEKANHQNEQKNLFLGTAAHDLCNPLGIILNSADLLEKQTRDKLDSEQLHYLSWIYNSAEFALNLVTNLLDVAKIESGHLELNLVPTDLVSVIDQVITINRLLADTKQIALEFHHSSKMPKLIVDPLKIQQLMNNLISNALKYAYSQTKVTVDLCWQGDKILISVADQGQGIPIDEIGKLFKPFSKTSVKSTQNEKGTGLGLLICRQVVEAHRGQIWLESEVGKGSVFYVLLPTI